MSDPIVITLPPDIDPAALEKILAALPESGVVAEPAEAAPAPDTPAFAEALADAAETAEAFPARVESWADAMTAAGMGPWTAVGIVAVILAGAYLVERAARLVRFAEPAHGAAPGPFTQRVRGALWWFGGRLISLGLFYALAAVALRLALPAHALPLGSLALSVAMRQRIIFAIIEALAAPGAAWRRAPGLSDEDAVKIARYAFFLLIVSGALMFSGGLIRLAEAGPSGRFLWALLSFAAGAAQAGFFIAIRRPIAGLIRRAFPSKAGFVDDVLVHGWHVAYVAMAAFSALVTAALALGIVPQNGLAGSVSGSLVVAALAPFAIAGVSAWRDERIAADPAHPHSLLRGGAALAKGGLAVGAAVLVLEMWGLEPFQPTNAEGGERFIAGLVQAGFILAVGFAIWSAVSDLIAVWAPDKRAAHDPTKPMDDDIGAPGSRLETVAPILRGAAMAGILVVTAMLALAAIGVNITPILAGAGVIGLAIGFGSQKLVADVINGMFYLYEDAFRIGEYVESGAGKGVVEAISLRSVRLRHPRGPVFTVPFSSMGTIQNHSRDWVKIKFSFDVPQETDLEKVRKLVKKAGEALMADPEVAERILEPMKSQGAINIKGHAFEVGVKFTTKPGQQFLVRRKAMAALQKTFADNGIELVTPKVTFESAMGMAGDMPHGAAAKPG